MKNVYDAVNSFYEQDAAWEDIIKHEWVEGFLRKKAWQHVDDKRLQEIWQQVLMFGLYLAYADIPVQETKFIDYSEMLGWLERNVAEFKIDAVSVERYFDALIDFYDYLATRRVVEPSDALKEATADFNRGRLRLAGEPDSELSFFIPAAGGMLTPDAPAPIYIKLDEHLHELFVLLNQFYQKKKYLPDFERAIFFYHGIMCWEDEDIDSRKQDFWLGFWDYFLFDYRLLKNDKSPLLYFRDCGECPREMAGLLDELIKARFAVFFVKSVSSEDWLECEDLLTGQTFFLPNPMENLGYIKELLFMGHLFSDTMVLVNYVMSVPVSVKLRRRIKDEVEKQMTFYKVQERGATWEDFLHRHAVAVRHTIDILTTFSKLNVVPEVRLPEPAARREKISDVSVIGCLMPVLLENLFSFHDQQLILRMWLDYCGGRRILVRKPELWAAGLVAAFADINSSFEVNYGYIADMFKIPLTAVYRYKSQIVRLLGIQPHDPRYLNEEGFIMLLMSY